MTIHDLRYLYQQLFPLIPVILQAPEIAGVGSPPRRSLAVKPEQSAEVKGFSPREMVVFVPSKKRFH